MADYIYTMEIRLTPDQLKGVNLVQEVARAAGITLYLTGGAIRDIISGFTIRDLDFTVQGNPLKLQRISNALARTSPATRKMSAPSFWCCPAMYAPKSAWHAPSTMERLANHPLFLPPAFRKICAAATLP